MLDLSPRCKSVLAGKIRHYKEECFPGKGGGIRLAEELGTSPQNVSSWIKGRRLPTLVQLYRLAKVFDVSPLELCGMRKRNTKNLESIHTTVFQKLIRHCDGENMRDTNPPITRKHLFSIIHIAQNELYN